MKNQNIAIIDYGAGNIKSLQTSLNRFGVNTFLSNKAEELLKADKVIFPGVGQAKWAMQKLNEHNLCQLIKDLKQPVLGICLGMQLMCKTTEEGNSEGLGIFDNEVKLFSNLMKVPHMGWNKIYQLKGSLYNNINNPYVYFVHSYYVNKNKAMSSVCEYSTEFAASLEKDNFFACQFHPEKSGVVGQKIIENFLKI